MCITNISDDYNDTLSINDNFTNNDTNIEIIIPLITIIPCTLSFICLLSLMVYTLIKPFFHQKLINKWINFYTQIILFDV